MRGDPIEGSITLGRISILNDAIDEEFAQASSGTIQATTDDYNRLTKFLLNTANGSRRTMLRQMVAEIVRLRKTE